MTAPRFVVLSLSAPRATWATDVARWATAGTLPIEVVRCLSADELAARLGGTRRYSAALLDLDHPGVDRDLVARCRDAGCAPLAVGEVHLADVLDVACALPPPLGAPALADALAVHARSVAQVDELPIGPTPEPVPWRAPLVAITGIGGSGTSTLAMGVAATFAARGDHGDVLLADLALRADQALLHGTGAVVPGLPELVERHRAARPEIEELRPMTFGGAPRGYDLLIGLRRPSEWTALRPRAVEAALENVRRTWDLVVADVDATVEGHEATGSVDVEERHCLARLALTTADVVVVTTRPGLTGTASLVRTIEDLLGAGVSADRILPVCTRTPRGPAGREVAAAADALLADHDLHPVLRLPDVRRTEAQVRDTATVPERLARPLADAVLRALGDVGRAEEAEPRPITPGSLGTLAHGSDDAA